MIQDLPVRNFPYAPFKFKRYFESKNQMIRVFGPCEVTGKNYEMFVPVEGFFVYLQGFKTIAEALGGTPEEDRIFILKGISPEGQKTFNI
jgi:hypothetical protein